jgi:hypothetical protein
MASAQKEMKDKIPVDKDFLMKVLEHVDALTKRVEKIESSEDRYKDFKMMWNRANAEVFEEIKKNFPAAINQTPQLPL